MSHSRSRMMLGIVMMALVGMFVVPEGSAEVGKFSPMPADQRWVAGEIAAVNLPQGVLRVREYRRGSAEGIREFAINRQDTTVTDAWDQLFLKLEDLKAGHLVQVEYTPADRGYPKAKTILVQGMLGQPPRPFAADLQSAAGKVIAVNIPMGVLTIEEARPGASTQRVEFLMNWRDTNVLLDPPNRFLLLEDLRPGDLVQVSYVIEGGQRKARVITIQASEPSR